MQGLPMLHPRVHVQAVGFHKWKYFWLGIIVTPWCMNVILAKGQPSKWKSIPEGRRLHYPFPAGIYDFISVKDRILGEYQMCSLMSPLEEVVSDHDMAVEIAKAALEELMKPEQEPELGEPIPAIQPEVDPETIEKAEIVDKATPCDIVAAQDGVILKITAERGTPLVSEGDVVKKGDVLISSEVIIGLEGEEQHPEYVAAEGAVTARVWLRLAEDAPFAYEEIVYDGEVQENHSLIFDSRELDLLHPSESREGREWEKKPLWERPLALGDFELPLKWKKESWHSFSRVQKTRTPEEAKALLEENLRKKTENLLSAYGTIEDIEIHYTEYADSIHAEAEVSLTERIEEKQTTEKERETENGTI
jgi:[NiFe] hydrogenase assembly HybE family chaperone